MNGLDFMKRLNVVPLSRTIKCQKVSTRSERNAQSKSASASTDSSLKQRWLPSYTALDLSKMQREDPDLMFIHLLFDEDNKPDRDTAASMSPAVRKYELMLSTTLDICWAHRTIYWSTYNIKHITRCPTQHRQPIQQTNKTLCQNHINNCN